MTALVGQKQQSSPGIYSSDTDECDDNSGVALLLTWPGFDFQCLILLKVSESFLSSLERLVVLMIENFPRLNKKVHFICFLSIFRIYFALGRKGIVCHGFLSRTSESHKFFALVNAQKICRHVPIVIMTSTLLY